MSTKHFFNDAEALVLDSLESLTDTNPTLRFDRNNKAIFLAGHNPTSQIALIAGGGAGHEPAHAAYVGDGLLTAAVSGSIFASPSVRQIVNTIARVGGKAGTILIIKNYTGDIFHFHLAAEKARANYGVKVEIVVVGDDVSVGRAKSGKVGRRGLAGTILVHKVLGAMSKKENVNFEALVRMGRLVASNLVTVGVSLGHVHIPGREIPKDVEVKQNTLELGMGIHNESGCRILSPQPDLAHLVEIMLDQLLDMNDSNRAFVNMQDATDVVALINNLGSISVLELGGITKVVVSSLEKRGVPLSRVLSGTFMTSLDGPGFSITLLKATPEMIEYIDAPTYALGWSAPTFPPSAWSDRESRVVPGSNNEAEEKVDAFGNIKLNASEFRSRVSQACRNVIDDEPKITRYDTIVGDGDCGETLARGARAVMAFLDSPKFSEDAVSTLLHLANAIENSMDGTSGAIYGIFFAALAATVRSLPSSIRILDTQQWGKVANDALTQLQLATPARTGDRTLMDALEPFIKSLAAGDTIDEAVEKARVGVEATKGMEAAFGRAVYVEESAWSTVPDPGAEGVLSILNGLAGK